MPGNLLVWIIVEQGPTALAVGAGRGCFDFSLDLHHFSFCLCLEDGRIKTEILTQRAVKPKTADLRNRFLWK